jgi:uncharacterized protein YjdB
MFMKKIFLLLTLLCAGFYIQAQTAASYGFSAFTAPYSSISGTGTMLPLLSDDDVTELSVPIGFTFNYCGTPYTTTSICTNGWISLSNSPAIDWTNLPFLIDGPGWIMPFWDDMEGLTAGSVYHQTTGVAPNRIFTVEWNAFESIIGFGTLNFQVKLYETSNRIDFHYGTSSAIFTDATIGISNDNISDWQTLSDEGPSPTPLLFPAFEDLIFGAPAADQVYRWTPACLLPAPITGTLTICTGTTTTLAHDTLGGVWSSSSPAVATVGSTTGIVTGVSAGTAGITYTAASGCIATAIVTVTAVAPITGTLTICESLSTFLSHPVPGGTWSSSDPVIADAAATPGFINGFIVGTATISYTLPSGCVATAVVTVTAIPGSITGPSNVCQGSTVSLTSSPAGGTWNSGFPGIASIGLTTGLVSGLTGGTTTITYTLPSGCFRVIAFTVNPLPAPIAGGTSICVSGTLSLTNTTAGGTWSSATPAVGTIDSVTGVFTGISPGTTVVRYILPTGCFRTTTINVTGGVAPITGDFDICMLAPSNTLACATIGGTWSSSDVSVATIGVSSGTYSAVAPGTATISYVLGSGCFSAAVVTVNPMVATTGTPQVCMGSSTTLSNTTPPSGTGTWSSSDLAVFTIGSGSGVITPVGIGIANVTYTMPVTGCSFVTTVTVNETPAAFTGSLVTCVGNATTLTTTPAGGAWSFAPAGIVSMAPAGTFTGVSVGTVNISYVLPVTGCFRTEVMTVNPTPAAISGVTVVCPGVTSALSHTTPGGTWTSSSPAVATVGSSSGIVTGVGLAGGTTTITYTLPASACFTTVVVTVQPAPNAIAGTLSICAGSTTTLSTTSLGATWSSSNTAVATIGSSSGTVTGVAAGTATITCFGTNGCTRTAVVTVNALPAAITGSNTVCTGATTTLNSTTPGGTWTSSNAAVGTVSAGGGVVGGIAANTVTITYTLSTGCFRTYQMTVNATPTAFTPTTNALCIGNTVTFASTPGAGTWASSNTAVATAGAGTGLVSSVAVGITTISYTHPSNGCVRTRVLTVNPLPGTIGGSTTICPASTVTLTNSDAGGTWSSSNTAVGTIVAGTGALTGISGGTTTITYTLSTGCIRTTDVTVIAAPVALISPIGDTILCPGDFVTLTSSAAAGATYQWYNGGVLIPGITTPTYTTGTGGTYQVRVSVAAGCSTLSPIQNVSVVPATATITVPGGSTTGCSGTGVALNANTGVGLSYQWELAGSAIAGATASTYTALTSGNYTVRITNGAGCFATSAPTTITIVPAPSNVVAASGPLTFCTGASVTLSAATGTGYTYQWHNTAGPIAGATTSSYTTSTAEGYHVVITGPTGCATTTAIVNVVVNALPNAAITPGGPTLFCSGGVVALAAAPGFTYQWYRNGTVIAGATNAAYIASATGGYRVRVTNTTTGCTAMTMADTTVNVVASPTIVALTPAKFCWGGSSLLSTSASSLGYAISYQWYFNTSAIVGATNPTYNATTPGNYSCTISVPASCTASTGPIAVSQVPLPDPPISFTGSALKTGNYYVTYQWYKNLVAIPGATSYMTPSTGGGSYKVAVTDTNGCQAVSAAYVLGGGPTSVENVNSIDVRIFPNPANQTVHIACPVATRVVVTGVDGKVLINMPDAKEINVAHLADGLYMISVFDASNNLLKTEKLVKRSE